MTNNRVHTTCLAFLIVQAKKQGLHLLLLHPFLFFYLSSQAYSLVTEQEVCVMNIRMCIQEGNSPNVQPTW